MRRFSTSLAPSCLRSRVRDSLERLSKTKWLARPFTVLSYPRAKSPTSGRSTFMTRAPRSASWRVAKGAATACSSATTVMPSRGRIPEGILEGPRQPEDVLGDAGEDQVRRDRGDLVEPRLPEFPLHVVLGVETVSPEGLHHDVRRLSQVLVILLVQRVHASRIFRPAYQRNSLSPAAIRCFTKVKKRAGLFGPALHESPGSLG